MYQPFLIYQRYRDRRKAREAGLSLVEWYRHQTEKITAETAQINLDTQSLRAQTVQELAELIPGASYDELENGIPFLSLRFILRSIMR